MLDDADFVARLCKNSSLDQTTRSPTVASFEFRLGADGQWNDTYLSVDGMELLPDGTGTHQVKLARLRQYQVANPHGVALIRPTVNMAYAVLSVGTIRAAQLNDIGTTLECQLDPRADGDPHCGIQPNPGVDHWQGEKDDPAHLAVKQYLFLNICHHERAIPIAA